MAAGQGDAVFWLHTVHGSDPSCPRRVERVASVSAYLNFSDDGGPDVCLPCCIHGGMLWNCLEPSERHPARGPTSLSHDASPLNAACGDLETLYELDESTASGKNRARRTECSGRQLVGTPFCKLFLASVSLGHLPRSHESHCWYCITVIPSVTSVPGDALLGLPADVEHAGWLLFCWSSASSKELMNAFGRAGVLRTDFTSSFTPELTDEQFLCKGAYASVFRLRMRPDLDRAVAVKRLNSDVRNDAVERELETLLAVSPHENIIGFLGVFQHHDGSRLQTLIAFSLAHGDLLGTVLREGPMGETVARGVFRGIVRGLAKIHSHGIVHRDIKGENILLGADKKAYLADFGLAAWTDDEVEMTRRCGSPGFCAPEICLGKRYGCKVDVFGAGVALFMMLSQQLPFISEDKDIYKTMKNTVRCTLYLHRPPFDNMTKLVRAILLATICRSSDDRLSAEEAFGHEWLSQDSRQQHGATPALATEEHFTNGWTEKQKICRVPSEVKPRVVKKTTEVVSSWSTECLKSQPVNPKSWSSEALPVE